ncbi:Na/Pi cotransporter family protein [Candidatus Micrarchaeota archaeon]|nr:Na/Pi cotransporter family protein [Candidatus Micrarchaeota archaeon]
MVDWELIQLLFIPASALILFIYGIDHLSRELRRIAGQELRGIIGKIASNRWAGAFVGAILTAVIQSSTATTTITVGLVSAGILTFTQALGVIAGANIGTTITGQLVAFDLTNIAPIFITLGFLISIFGGKFRIIGKPFFYFGLVLFSLALLSQAVDPFKNEPWLVSLFTYLDNPFIGLLAGILITILFQSSSVTTGMIVLLGSQGLLSLLQAIPILLGTNLGTTSTTILISYNKDLFAKRTAIGHLIFNLGGVLLLLPFIFPFADFVASLGGELGNQVANAHTIFNVGTAFLFLLLIRPASRIIEKIVPGKEKEIVFGTKYLKDELPKGNKEAIRIIIKELKHHVEIIEELFKLSVEMVKKGDGKEYETAEKFEEVSDFLNEKVSEALIELSKRKLTKEQAEAVTTLSKISNEMEHLGDLGEKLGYVSRKMYKKDLRFYWEEMKEFETMSNIMIKNIQIVKDALSNYKNSHYLEMKKNKKRAKEELDKYYKGYLERVMRKEGSSYGEALLSDAIVILEQSIRKINKIMSQIKEIKESF